MTSTPDLPGFRLSALAPVYEFTNHTDWVYSGGAVFLMDHDGSPHWFATDGYSAMLTPALHDEANADLLFEPTVGQRCYRPEHIKALFRHVRHGTVVYDPAVGTLTSPDGIMIVPPHVEEGDDAQRVLPPETYASVFEGEEVEQATFEFGWKFVASIRAAFKAGNKDADLTMTCLEGSRVRLNVEEPYRGTVLIALKRDAEKAEALKTLKKSMQDMAGKDGIESVTLSAGGKTVTFGKTTEEQDDA